MFFYVASAANLRQMRLQKEAGWLSDEPGDELDVLDDQLARMCSFLFSKFAGKIYVKKSVGVFGGTF